MHPAIVTVNCSYKVEISEKELAEIIKSGELPEEKRGYLEVFFSEVPLSEIVDFCDKYGITINELKNFYERNIKPLFSNKELEELWKI